MFDLYTAASADGHKVSILLEELGLPYAVHALSLDEGDQHQPAYRHLNPDGRVPTLVDRDADDFVVFESNAILLYLAEKCGAQADWSPLPGDARGRSRVQQWLLLEAGGLAPMQREATMFLRDWHERYQPAIERYQSETRRVYALLDRRLTGRDYLCDRYSIADIAMFPRVNSHAWAGVAVDELPQLKAWLERLRARPAVLRGLAVPPPEMAPAA